MSGIGTPEWMGRLRSLRCRFVLVGLRDAEMDEMLRMDHQLRGFEAAADRPMPPGWKRADQHTPRDGQRVLVKLPQCRELVMEWDAARRVRPRQSDEGGWSDRIDVAGLSDAAGALSAWPRVARNANKRRQ